MVVRVKQSLDFLYFLQFVQCPTVFVVLSCIAAVLFRQGIDIINELPVLTDIGSCGDRPLPADLAEMESESCRERQHVAAEAVRPSVSIKVLRYGRTREFHKGTDPFGDAILSLYAVKDCERIVAVRRMMQQTDTREGRQMPTYLFLPGIAKEIDTAIPNG